MVLVVPVTEVHAENGAASARKNSIVTLATLIALYNTRPQVPTLPKNSCPASQSRQCRVEAVGMKEAMLWATVNKAPPG